MKCETWKEGGKEEEEFAVKFGAGEKKIDTLNR